MDSHSLMKVNKMTDRIYQNLRIFLDGLPGGFPATPSGTEIKILKKLFTLEQAELAMKLTYEPEELSVISDRIGLEKTLLAGKLEEMAKKGLIFRVRKGDKCYYHAEQFIIGIYEFQAKNKDSQFYRLFEEYIPYLGISLAGLKTKQMRYIPMESAITSEAEIATYNRVRDLLSKENIIAVQQCICKQTQTLQGNICQKPQEVCFAFGDFAHFIIDNEMGRQVTLEEAGKILEHAENQGLVLGIPNAQKLSFLCCCCTCCCPNLRFSKGTERPADMVLSYHESRIDSELCTGCGTCVERCSMDAIKLTENSAEVIDGRCIGCGLCVSNCPENAIMLKAKPGMEAPPTDFKDIFDRIAEERRLTSF
jgi:Na+-translocating ferredoxin:NAD+ oxidoreductase subunit B